jgi:RNA polymerase sigma-70 factor, ECF subfamily
LLSHETRRHLLDAVEELPPTQRRVLTLRDVEGWLPAEVCELLDLSDANQRELLHLARSKVRAALEQHMAR